MSRVVRTVLLAGALSIGLAGNAASAEYAPGRVIVKYAPATPSSLQDTVGKAAGVVQRLGAVAGVGAELVGVIGDPRDVAARLNRSPAVLYAEPDVIMHATSVPNDPLFGQLSGLNSAADHDIDAPEGWDIAFGPGSFPASGGPLVGIVDTGIDAGHEDLVGKAQACAGVKSFGILGLLADPTIVSGKCVDDNDHGTHVAGTVAAIANNGKGVAGVAFNSPLAICKALNSQGSGPTSGIANCITYLAGAGARVISMSLGGGSSTTMQQAVQNAYNGGQGAVIVAAAGNSGGSALEYPAGYPEVVSVSATDASDNRASFSTANADVEIAAPGVGILSTKRGGGYVAFSGTSMSTPHVAGVASLIAFRNPSWSAAQIRSKLDAATDDLGTIGRDPVFGFGRVNLVKAMQ